MIWAKAGAKLIAVLLVGSIIEGCILRDPWVELGNGYNIGAISWGSPCHLTYFASHDPRPASLWSCVDFSDTFALRNSETNEWRRYKTKEELQQAAHELRARPASAKVMLDHVTGFNANKRFAIGQNSDGYFLLDMAADALEKWPMREEWSSVVRARTGLDPEHLRDPKAWRFQYRHAGYWSIMCTFFGLGAVWIVAPLVRRRTAATASRP